MSAGIQITQLSAGTIKQTDVYPAVDVTDHSQSPDGTTKKYTLTQLGAFLGFTLVSNSITNFSLNASAQFLQKVDIGTAGQLSISDTGIVTLGIWHGTAIDGTYINYNTTNLKVTASQLDTIQGISTAASPTFTSLTATGSVAGTTYFVNTTNTDNTSGTSNAANKLKVGGTTAGDPYTAYIIGTSDSWAVGVDNSLTQKFSIRYSVDENASPSFGTDWLTITTGGLVSMFSLYVNNGITLATIGGGSLVSATTGGAFTEVASVATGNVLLSGGVGAQPTWGKVGLTTHVSGTLGVGNGGSGTATTFTQGSIVFAGASGVYSENNTGLFWSNSTGQFGVGTSSPSTDTLVQFTGSKANIITTTGTQTAVSSAGVQGTYAAITVLSPTNGSNLSTSFLGQTTILIPSGKTGVLVSSFAATPITNFNVGTVTEYAGFYFDGGNNSGGGTYTTTYGLLIKKPIFGSTVITARILGRTQIGTSQQFDVSDSGVVTAGTWNGTLIGVTYGGTGANLSATGGASQYLKQSSSGAAITVGTIPASDIASGAALTRTNDTNVTLTLGGTPTTALLAATSLTLGWTGQLDLTRGGTNASLTASNGGIVYSTASALAVLASTATALRMLQSGASTTPAWSTTTWPATTTINRLLWSSAANVISDLATANDGVLITSSGGVPSISSTIPNATQDNITRLGTIASVGAAIGVTFGGTGTSTQFTAGSVIYAGASGVYSQDNSNLFWDATNHRLGIGTTSPFYALNVQVASNTTVLLRDPTGVGVDGGTSGILFSIADTSVTTDQFAKGGIFFEKVNADGSARGKLHLCVNTASDSTNASKSNAIITLYNGFVQFNSTSFTANGTTATVLTSLGPAGANTTVQEWLTVKNPEGTTRYIAAY